MPSRAELSESPARKARASATSSATKWKLAFLLVVIVATVGWVVYLLVADRPKLEVPPAVKGVQAILNAVGDREDMLETLHIAAEGDPPAEIVLTGSVRNKKLLDELNGIVQAHSGGVPVKNSVTVKP